MASLLKRRSFMLLPTRQIPKTTPSTQPSIQYSDETQDLNALSSSEFINEPLFDSVHSPEVLRSKLETWYFHHSISPMPQLWSEWRNFAHTPTPPKAHLCFKWVSYTILSDARSCIAWDWDHTRCSWAGIRQSGGPYDRYVCYLYM